ncbi:hypothetical protein [Siminovitchia fortis]|uniref:hypothetical protein n=1 Tax=Siminovitchia fortis TaxID=254758 RepID=UPI0011A9661A|nr:hypothetical protein [Siminovitchia fortis]
MFSKQLVKEAGKYKKWLEAYSINPYSYPINGRAYYLTIYGKNPQQFKGYAVILVDGGPSEEYRHALFPLTIFSAANANIFDFGGPRSRILPTYYQGIIQEIQTSADPNLAKTSELFSKLLELQLPFNQLYREYDDFYNQEIMAKKTIADKDIEHTLITLAKLDLLQFRQGVLLETYDEIMPEFFRKAKEMRGKLPSESWNFIKGMQDNRNILGKRMADFDFERSIMSLPEEEQIERKIQDAKRNAEKLINERESLLRGPAAL